MTTTSLQQMHTELMAAIDSALVRARDELAFIGFEEERVQDQIGDHGLHISIAFWVSMKRLPIKAPAWTCHDWSVIRKSVVELLNTKQYPDIHWDEEDISNEDCIDEISVSLLRLEPGIEALKALESDIVAMLNSKLVG